MHPRQLHTRFMSQVYKAMYDDVHTVALKVLQQTGDTPSAAMFDKELAILRKCHNKNIVQFFGACLTVRTFVAL